MCQYVLLVYVSFRTDVQFIYWNELWNCFILVDSCGHTYSLIHFVKLCSSITFMNSSKQGLFMSCVHIKLSLLCRAVISIFTHTVDCW